VNGPEQPIERVARRGPGPAFWVAIGLAVVLAALVAIIAIVSGRLPGLGDGASASASPSPATTASPAVPTDSPEPSFIRPTPLPPTPVPTFLVYVVRSGDSLTSIARAHETTARSIAFWNRDAYPSLDPESEGYSPNRIEVGWALALIPGTTYDETARPSQTPPATTPAPATPGPSAQPTMPPVVGSSVLVSNGPRGTNKVALTLDMGGRVEPAVDIVRWLIDHEVRATLFPTGKTGTANDQGRAALQLAATRPDLFEIANHSWDHPDFRTLTDAQVADQLTRTETAITALIGRTTKPFFRPPFGGINSAARAAIGRAGWGYTVMWDVDTIDWRPVADGGPTAADIVAKVSSKAEGGSIVLMHLGGWNTLEARTGMIAGLQAKSIQPVTLTELLAP